MSLFPAGFDPRDEAVGLLDLVSIDTPDGVFRFLLGADGMFTDHIGRQWIGSTLIDASEIRMSIQGEAPAGSLGISFVPDPDGIDLVARLRELGTEYVAGREIIFWVQPITSMNELYAPTLAPIRWATRRAAHIEIEMQGLLQRSLRLTYEGPFTGRNTANGRQYTVADHAALIGVSNSSLRFMPNDLRGQEALF